MYFPGLWLTTECGRLQICPGEVAVVPQGFRFTVSLPDGPSRGYVAEIFGAHFHLPDLGPIGLYSNLMIFVKRLACLYFTISYH